MNQGILNGLGDFNPGTLPPGCSVEIFVQTGTFYPKLGAKGYFVTSRGAGGGGATGRFAAGGGGGAYNEQFFHPFQITGPIAVQVGVGGSGGPANVNNTNGVDGGASSFGGQVVAYGGMGGTFSTSENSFGVSGGGLLPLAQPHPATTTDPSFAGGGRGATTSTLATGSIFGGAGSGASMPGNFALGGSSLRGGGGGGGTSSFGPAQGGGAGGTTGKITPGGGGAGGFVALGAARAGDGADGTATGMGGGAGGGNFLSGNSFPGARGGNGGVGAGGGGGGMCGADATPQLRGKGGDGGRGEVIVYYWF